MVDIILNMLRQNSDQNEGSIVNYERLRHNCIIAIVIAIEDASIRFLERSRAGRSRPNIPLRTISTRDIVAYASSASKSN